MTARSFPARAVWADRLNFVLTNCLPRRLLTGLVGWFSHIEQPLVRDLSIGVWRLFSDLDLNEAKHKKFTSLRACFIRELKEGVRPIQTAPEIVVSPCDAIVGAAGTIADGELLQVKGSPYPLSELLGGDGELAGFYRGGCYATLRLTASMYHRFHAPHDCRVERLTHLWGDTWNVNPPTLARVPKVFCRNERAVIRIRLAAGDHLLTLVPVAAILVAGIRLRFGDRVMDPRREKPLTPPAGNAFRKGEEMGWFEHGSTILVLAPPGFRLTDAVRAGDVIRMGESLMRLPFGRTAPGRGDEYLASPPA